MFPTERHCTTLRSVRNILIINDIIVEAAGVELFRVLITRNLLILGTATTAKTATSPDPLYVYCTKMFFAPEARTQQHPQYPIDSPGWIEKKAPGFPPYRKSPPFLFFVTPACRLCYFRFARHPPAMLPQACEASNYPHADLRGTLHSSGLPVISRVSKGW
jgi:hypothetical protein